METNMNRIVVTALTLAGMIGVSSAAAAYDGDWKRGRVYYRGVCTPCHMASKPEGIAPSQYTKAEWTAYFQADKHQGGKETVKQFISQQFRASIKASNKVAEKFGSVSDADLFEDVKAFVINGAKDGDAPATCN
jgi:cytochrome c5